ncbi:MAG: AMP-binding protein [Acidimicrobiales bacterium]
MSNTSPLPLAEELTASALAGVDGLDLRWLLDEQARRRGDHPFLVWEPFEGDAITWTYAELRDRAHGFAAGLHERGVQAGDFVIVHLDNSPEFLEAWWGCAVLGAVAVSTNTRSVARDLSYFADHVSAVCAITQPSFARLVVDSCPGLRFVACTDNDAGDAATVPDDLELVAFADLVGDPSALPELATDPMRNLSVQFTSGTTSRPKAVLWTHANGLWAGKISAAHMRLRADDVTLTFLPMFHTNAQGYSMLATVWSGGTMVLQPKFSASRFWEVSMRHRCTWTSTIPFVFKAIAGQPIPEHHYRFWGVPAHLPELGAVLGIEQVAWWGMTETLTHGIVTDVDHPGPARTIGRVAPEYEIQVRRPGSRELVEPGEKGHLYIRGVRGVSLFKEYYRNDEANDSAFDEHGWFETGDVILVDDDGWLYFSDRDKDMLKVGAENVAASEIESVILQTGLVDEVAVVAQQHDMLDEVPVAFVIPVADADRSALPAAVIDYCRRQLADFKVVRDVHVVDELPRSTLEKVAKAQLRARLPPIVSG